DQAFTQCAVLIEGDLDAATLKQAIERVIDRREILRTTFRLLPELAEPLQVIGGRGISFQHEDRLVGMSADKRESCLDALLAEQKRTIHDFAERPLVVATLFDLAPFSHWLLVAAPVLCADKIGIANLVEEIGHAYEAGLNDEE